MLYALCKDIRKKPKVIDGSKVEEWATLIAILFGI